MSKNKAAAGDGVKGDKKKVKWSFPRVTLEQALRIPIAIKDLNGGNPWEPEEIRKAIGAGVGNPYFYLTAGSRDYGLTVGTRDAEKISLADLGRDLVYAGNPAAEAELKMRAFLNVEVFKRVLEYYKGSNLPEMKYLGNTLQKESQLTPETHEEFSRIFRENCKYLGVTSGTVITPDKSSIPWPCSPIPAFPAGERDTCNIGARAAGHGCAIDHEHRSWLTGLRFEIFRLLPQALRPVPGELILWQVLSGM